MEGHTATLTPALKMTIAREAIAGQDRYGAMSAIAAEHGVSRQTVYTLLRCAEQAIEMAFDAPSTARRRLLAKLDVDAEHITRVVLALRTVGHNSIPDIVELSRLVLGVHRGYGTVWRILDGGAQRAEAFHRSIRLDSIEAIALDEIFVGRKPVLAARCLVTGFVVCCVPSDSRDAEAWQAALAPCVDRGLSPKVVLSDGAQGIKKAVAALWPDAELREDLFHIKRRLRTDARWFFSRALRAIKTEYKAADKHSKASQSRDPELASLAQKHRRAREKAACAIERSDAFEQLVTTGLDEALALFDHDSGQLRHTGQMHDALVQLCQRIEQLDHSRARKCAGYLRRRIPWLLAHLDERDEAIEQLEADFGPDAVRFAALLWQARGQLRERPDEPKTWAQLRAACAGLARCGLDEPGEEALLEQVEAMLTRRYHRASSSIESFNSLLRPHLDVHRGASARFLSLFCAYQNLRQRRSGRHKGRSAYEMLCELGAVGEDDDRPEPSQDWLSVLGLPPSGVTLH